MTDGPLEHVAAELRWRQQTVHERVACPTCLALVGHRCWSLTQGQGGRELKHPHRARLRADGLHDR